MFKILVIEDNKTISDELVKYLESWGYTATGIDNFHEILNEVEAFSPNLILLDITLPHHNGFYWCQEIRKTSNVPIIFISSATDNMNQLMALNMGGDDFISKPFDMEILVAKIQALLRRTYDFTDQITTIAFTDGELNINDTTITYKDKKIELTKNEFKIMKILLENKNSIVSRDEIIEKLWQTESFIDDNTLTVNVNRLRNELASIGLENFIHTKRGMGYYVED